MMRGNREKIVVVKDIEKKQEKCAFLVLKIPKIR